MLCAGGKAKHAFLGLGFRDRPEAYDFQAAVFDHIKYPYDNYILLRVSVDAIFV